MDHNKFLNLVESNPVIASVKNEEGLKKALQTDVEIIFILYGDVCTIPAITERIRNAGKVSMVHMDLIGGLSHASEAAVDYIRQYTAADGIITTKSGLAEKANKLGLRTVLRFFVLDSMALENIRRQAKSSVQPDLIEILPGAVRDKIIKEICSIVKVPLIAGGLISSKEDITYALNAGALAVSSTNENLWNR
jgi:glycerol uptake operon antiterminator